VADWRRRTAPRSRAGANSGEARLSGIQSAVLVVFSLTCAALIWGVSSQGWWMAQMEALPERCETV
jgi:uncharacterized ion transporter superfamily protein YfcC